MRTTFSADLHVELQVDGAPAVRAHLTGQDSRLRMEVDHPSVFAGRGDAPVVQALAATMAARGVVVDVTHDGEPLISLGAVRAPWWHRRMTGSARIRVASWRGVVTAARARARGAGPVLPDLALAPPTTPWPPTPTLATATRRTPTTTHDPARGGGARLTLAKEYALGDERQEVYRLRQRTTIGSDPGCDIVLRGLEPRHALVVHTDDDEHVVRDLDGSTRVHGEPGDGKVLRTGARLDVGEHHLVFFREEYADHGRPYGGRIGGEAGHQRPQAPRAGRDDWSGRAPRD